MRRVIAADRALSQPQAATDKLLGAVHGLSDSAREPSILPGWTRGHVLSHLARHAEGGTRLLSWARTGIVSYEYEGMEARNAAIEEGAGRPAAVLVDNVRLTAAAFAEAAANMPLEGWRRTVR